MARDKSCVLSRSKCRKIAIHFSLRAISVDQARCNYVREQRMLGNGPGLCRYVVVCHVSVRVT